MRTYLLLAAAEFRRYSTYRLAILAGVTTQSVFGFIRVSVLFGAISSAGGTLAGYNQQLASTYVWLGQALLALSRCSHGSILPSASAAVTSPSTSPDRWTCSSPGGHVTWAVRRSSYCPAACHHCLSVP